MRWAGMERQHQSRHVEIMHRRVDAVLLALPGDLLDAASPGFDIAGPEKGMGDKRIEGP
jgi:hypothetical protein